MFRTPRWSVVLLAAVVTLTLSACSSSLGLGGPAHDAAHALPGTAAPERSTTPGASLAPSLSPSGVPAPPGPVIVPISSGRGPAGSLRFTGNATVALTFDDGPDPRYTPKILDLLKKYGVKATFCVVGFRARDNPNLIKRIVAEGHTLCNHSWQHLLTLGNGSDAAILKDLKATNSAIHKAVPGVAVRYFRAPGGNYNTRLVKLAASLGMASLYWAVDPRDWQSSRYGHGSSMVRHIVSTVKAYTRPGSIVLSHDLAKPDTITAYAILLPWLKARFTLAGLP